MSAPSGRDRPEGLAGEADLDAAFERSLRAVRSAPGPLGVLFSGGVDSGLLAWELRFEPGLHLYTVGTRDSSDLAAARDASKALGLPWIEYEVGPSEVLEMNRALQDEFDGVGRVARSVQVAFALALAKSPPRTLLCGQGIDELFGGYAHSRGLPLDAAEHRANQDLAKLLNEDWPRTQRIAARLGRSVRAPYLDPGFIEASRRIPGRVRFQGSVPKAFFRSWARHRGLPELLSDRPKKALQFGSGIERVLGRGG